MLSKATFRQIFIGFLLGCTLISCQPERISPAALLDISPVQGQFLRYDPTNSFYAFEIKANTLEQNKVEYVRVLLSYENGAPVEWATLNNFPAQVKFSLAEVVEKLGQVQLSDMARGSIVSLSFVAKNEGASEESLPTQMQMPIECPEPGIAGTYHSMSSGTTGPGGGGKYSDIQASIEIEEINLYEYRISDATGGVFTEIWAANPEPAIFREYCRTLEFPSFTDQFDDTFTGQAQLLPDGSIELRWESSYGDTGISLFRK